MFDEAVRQDGVAVVTGGASGLGLAAARAFAARGLNVVLADLSGDALDAAVRAVSVNAGRGATVLPYPVDVANREDVDALAERCFGIGPVAVLMNNAGTAPPTASWTEPENWRRLMEVNLFGVLNGVQAFLPRMVKADRPAVVVNTGSKQGITSPPGNPGYNVSKAGVKVLTEMLAHDLRQAGAPVSAHLFVPGFSYTGMIASFLPEKPPAAWTPEQAVKYLLTRLSRGDFYILCPDNEVTEAEDRRRVAWAAGDIIRNRPALSRWHPDFIEEFARFEGE